MSLGNSNYYIVPFRFALYIKAISLKCISPFLPRTVW